MKKKWYTLKTRLDDEDIERLEILVRYRVEDMKRALPEFGRPAIQRATSADLAALAKAGKRR